MELSGENYLSNPYFFVSTKSGKQLLGRIDISSGVFGTSKDKNEKLVIDFPTSSKEFIKLTDVFEITLVKISGEVKPIPVQFDQTATGSSSVLLSRDSLEMINVIDENSKTIQAIRAIDSGIIPATSEADIENSSKVIHRFSKR